MPPKKSNFTVESYHGNGEINIMNTFEQRFPKLKPSSQVFFFLMQGWLWQQIQELVNNMLCYVDVFIFFNCDNEVCSANSDGF